MPAVSLPESVDTVPQDAALAIQLAMVAGRDAGDSHIESRRRVDGRWQSRYCRAAIEEVAQAAESLREQLPLLPGDFFVGPAVRSRSPGSGYRGCATDDDVAQSWVLWCDCDSAESVGALMDFDHVPTMIVRSGGSNHIHVYWALTRPVPADLVRRCNGRLAYRLGADANSTNPSRLLRLVGSTNTKHDRMVTCADIEPVVYRPGVLVNRLKDHPRDDPAMQARARDYFSLSSSMDTERRLAGPLRALRGKPEGGRNGMLYWVARTARDEGCDLDVARPLLIETATEVGLEANEIIGTIASAWRSRP
jgi:hypothetical protein